MQKYAKYKQKGFGSMQTCELKLQLPIAAEEATHYIDWTNNEPRQELMSYYLVEL